MIVVLDSNVWISALHFGGTPLRALHKTYVLDRIACCAEIRTEVERALIHKLNWSAATARVVMQPFLEDAIEVYVTGTPQAICRDPDDDIIFECALLAEAHVIVTGDRDLLAVGSYAGIQVMTTRAYLDLPPDETPQ